MRITAFFFNPFADGLLISREISKVSFGLPEGFSVTAEKAAARYVLSYSKLFGLLPKTLLPIVPPKSGNLFLTYGNRVLFLVLDAVLFHLAVQRGTPDAEQFGSQRAVAIRLFQRTDYLLLFHFHVFQGQ